MFAGGSYGGFPDVDAGRADGGINTGQDPRGAPDMDPLWLMLDLVPEGRGTDWYPKLEYGCG
jgi:predicted dithiol-disulfide oxidoreductase (DUF899 family)